MRQEQVQDPYEIRWFANDQPLSALNDQTSFVINHQLLNKQIKCQINGNCLCVSKQFVQSIENEILDVQQQKENDQDYVKFIWKYPLSDSITQPQIMVKINYQNQEKQIKITDNQGFYINDIYNKIYKNIYSIDIQIIFLFLDKQQQFNINIKKQESSKEFFYQDINQTYIDLSQLCFQNDINVDLCEQDDYYLKYLQQKQTNIIIHYFTSTRQVFLETEQQCKVYIVSQEGKYIVKDLINVNKCQNSQTRKIFQDLKINRILDQKYIQLQKQDLMLIIQEQDNYDFIYIQDEKIETLQKYFTKFQFQSQLMENKYNISINYSSFNNIKFQIYDIKKKQFLNFTQQNNSIVTQLNSLNNIQLIIIINSVQFIVNLSVIYENSQEEKQNCYKQEQIILELSEEPSQELLFESKPSLDNNQNQSSSDNDTQSNIFNQPEQQEQQQNMLSTNTQDINQTDMTYEYDQDNDIEYNESYYEQS